MWYQGGGGGGIQHFGKSGGGVRVDKYILNCRYSHATLCQWM